MELSQDMLGFDETTRYQAGKLGNSGSIPGIIKRVLSLQSAQMVCMPRSAASQGVEEDHSVAVKLPELYALVCCLV